ncbi:type II toxin-antitoxin system RelE/ParE family toxin [bacterium]|nr:type II toxin-antitoxin system RelE/ParE family toxin [bacterium]
MALIKKTRQAEEDLYQIWYFIAIENQSPVNAERFILQLDHTIQLIANNPGIGVSKDEYARGVYQFSFQDYLLFYTIIDGGINLVRVLHGARDIQGQF